MAETEGRIKWRLGAGRQGRTKLCADNQFSKAISTRHRRGAFGGPPVLAAEVTKYFFIFHFVASAGGITSGIVGASLNANTIKKHFP